MNTKEFKEQMSKVVSRQKNVNINMYVQRISK